MTPILVFLFGSAADNRDRHGHRARSRLQDRGRGPAPPHGERPRPSRGLDARRLCPGVAPGRVAERPDHRSLRRLCEVAHGAGARRRASLRCSRARRQERRPDRWERGQTALAAEPAGQGRGRAHRSSSAGSSSV